MQKHPSHNESDWKEKLTPEEYRVLRKKGTEAPFTGEYVDEKRAGTYRCRACGSTLFSSSTKFDSGTGWPSFEEALPGSVEYIEDSSHGMTRTEVVCANCRSHLGHVFPELMTPTRKRYCINSVCLDLEEKSSKETGE